MARITLILKTNDGGAWVLPQLRELARRGNTVTVIIPGGFGRLRKALDAGGVAVLESPFDFSFRPSRKLATGLARLRRLIRSTCPDVLFYHLYASALASRIASLGMKLYRVHMVAGPLYLESNKIRFIERFICRLDQQIIAGSRFTEDRYREIGMPSDRLTCVPYGVDIEKFRKGANERSRLFGSSEHTFVAIMVAYVYAPKRSVFPGVGVKGHEVLLPAWDAHCALWPDSLLVLVGNGFDEAGERHRQKLLADRGIGRNRSILWLETVADVRPYYSSADVSVSPSMSDNHGAVLEASAMGLPSIVSNAGALSEAVSEQSGWIVPAGDVNALVAALRDAAARSSNSVLAAMGNAAREVVESGYSLDRCVEQVADIIESRGK